jgi:hypothetical protein
LVDVLREVAGSIERAVDEGERSSQIDASDLVEAFLAVADRLDPPIRGTANRSQSVVDAARALLEARENQMVTAVEWDQLRRAVNAADRAG